MPKEDVQPQARDRKHQYVGQYNQWIGGEHERHEKEDDCRGSPEQQDMKKSE